MGGLSCAEQSVSGLARAARLNIAPEFAVSADAPFVPIASVLFVVRRLPSMEVVRERLVPFPQGEEALAVDLVVPILTPGDRFQVHIAALDLAGDTAYTSTVTDVRAAIGEGTSTPTAAPLVYSGGDTLVASVTMAPRDTSLTVGDSATLRAVARLADGTARPGAFVRFTSRDTNLIAIRGDNRMRAKAPTTGTWIVVTTANNRADSIRVSAVARRLPILERVEAGTDRNLVALGDTTTLVPVGRDAAGLVVPGLTFSFVSLNPSIATVTAAGLITAQAVGATDIIATFDAEARADTVRVTVTQVPSAVIVTPGSGAFTALNDETSYSAVVRDRNANVIPGASVAWSTSNAAVVTVSASGLVRATGNGTTDIRATSGSAVGIVPISVAQAVQTVTVARDTLRLRFVGDTATIVATMKDRNGVVVAGAPVGFASADAGVATVSAAGLVRLASVGNTGITVASGTKTALVVIIGTDDGVGVEAKNAWIRVTPGITTLAVGDSLPFVADRMEASGSATRLAPAWASAQPGRLSVSATGMARAVQTGTIVLTASDGGLSGQATVNVVAAPTLTSFSFAPRAVTGVTANALQFSVSLEANDAGAGIGSAVVTFTGPGGVTQSCTSLTPTWGSSARGGWDCVITIPAGSPAGTWRASSVVLNGSVARTYDETKLAAFGGTTLEVRP